MERPIAPQKTPMLQPKGTMDKPFRGVGSTVSRAAMTTNIKDSTAKVIPMVKSLMLTSLPSFSCNSIAVARTNGAMTAGDANHFTSSIFELVIRVANITPWAMPKPQTANRKFCLWNISFWSTVNRFSIWLEARKKMRHPMIPTRFIGNPQSSYGIFDPRRN